MSPALLEAVDMMKAVLLSELLPSLLLLLPSLLTPVSVLPLLDLLPMICCLSSIDEEGTFRF